MFLHRGSNLSGFPSRLNPASARRDATLSGLDAFVTGPRVGAPASRQKIKRRWRLLNNGTLWALQAPQRVACKRIIGSGKYLKLSAKPSRLSQSTKDTKSTKAEGRA